MAKPKTADKKSAKPAAEKAAKPAKEKAAAPVEKKISPDKIARELGSKLRQRGNLLQIDFGYFDLKQNGYVVGQVVVSQYVNGIITPGFSMEYYYLYTVDSGSYRKFKWPSKTNTPQEIEFVYSAGGPGPTFDPVQYQYAQPVQNQLIACTCQDMGIVTP